MRLALLLTLTAAATACSTSPPPAPAALDPAAPASPYTAFAKGPWKPIASADGRWTVQVVALTTDEVPTPLGDRFFNASVRFGSPDPGDAIVVAPPALRLATSTGAEPHSDPQWTSVWFGGTSVSLWAPIPADIDRLGFTELSCRLLRVLEWGTTDVVVEHDGQQAGVASPFRLFCTPETNWVWVAASLDEDALHAADTKQIAHLLGHRWASQAAEVADAHGAKLTAGGGHGEGGATATMFFADGGNGTIPIEYPVTVRLRVPSRYAVEDAVFRLDGLALPRHAAPD